MPADGHVRTFPFEYSPPAWPLRPELLTYWRNMPYVDYLKGATSCKEGMKLRSCQYGIKLTVSDLCSCGRCNNAHDGEEAYYK